MRLIGINGFKTSGKDTAYEQIKTYVQNGKDDPSYRVERRAFADKIKIMGAMTLGFDRPEEDLIRLMNSLKEGSTLTILYDDPESAPSTPFRDNAVLHSLTGRQYLQWFGQHARTIFGDDFWVKQVLPEDRVEYEKVWRTVGRTGAIACLPAIACVTDVRYPNEAQRVLELGGTVLEIVRPELQSDGHESEKPLPRNLVTRTVINDGTLDDLYDNLREVVDSL